MGSSALVRCEVLTVAEVVDVPEHRCSRRQVFRYGEQRVKLVISDRWGQRTEDESGALDLRNLKFWGLRITSR